MTPPWIGIWDILLVLGLFFGTPPLMAVVAGGATGWLVRRASVVYGVLVGIGLGILGSLAGAGITVLLALNMSRFAGASDAAYMVPMVATGLLFAAGAAFLTWHKSLKVE